MPVLSCRVGGGHGLLDLSRGDHFDAELGTGSWSPRAPFGPLLRLWQDWGLPKRKRVNKLGSDRVSLASPRVRIPETGFLRGSLCYHRPPNKHPEEPMLFVLFLFWGYIW